MLLLFLNDYLGIPFDSILAAMPATNGAPLGKTYEALVRADPALAGKGGRDGQAAFQTMISLLIQNTQRADRGLNLPASGNPFPSMPNSQQGGLFAAAKPPAQGSLAQDAQAALGLESQIEQQLAALKSTLSLIPGDVSGAPAPAVAHARAEIAEGIGPLIGVAARCPRPRRDCCQARRHQGRRPIRAESSEHSGRQPGSGSGAVPGAAVRSEPSAGFLAPRL